MVIKNFKDKKSSKIAAGVQDKTTIRHLPKELHAAAHEKLNILNSVTKLEQLRQFRSLRLEALKGDMKGMFSIRINDQYRICFKWERDSAVDVFITDYH